MVPALRVSVVLLAAALIYGSQVLPSSALTEEDRLRAAISNPTVTSFQLLSNIKLTKNLPVLALPSGQIRTLRVFSNSGFTIDGGKKYRGFYTPGDSDTFFRDFPILSLTIENVKFVNFRGNRPADISPLVGRGGAAIGVEKTILTVLNSAFSGCLAQEGGAIYIDDGTLQIKGTTFKNNVAQIAGAVSVATYGRVLKIEDSLFSGNVANGQTAYGGAISIQGNALVTIARTTFKGNKAGSGGAISALFSSNDQPPTPMLFDTLTFKSNKGTYSETGGAAIEFNGIQRVKFIKPIFTGNKMSNGVTVNIRVINPVGYTTTIEIKSGTIPSITSQPPGSFVIV